VIVFVTFKKERDHGTYNDRPSSHKTSHRETIKLATDPLYGDDPALAM
jgi:hypothetical protein